MAVGSFFMVESLSENVDQHGWPTTKNKKKNKENWLKRPNTVPQKAKIGPQYK